MIPFDDYYSEIKERLGDVRPKQYIKLLWMRNLSIEEAIKKINKHY